MKTLLGVPVIAVLLTAMAVAVGYRSARLGNACGAIVVTKHGCANFMPTMPEVEAFNKETGREMVGVLTARGLTALA